MGLSRREQRAAKTALRAPENRHHESSWLCRVLTKLIGAAGEHCVCSMLAAVRLGRAADARDVADGERHAVTATTRAG